jgi:hypothetical protein
MRKKQPIYQKRWIEKSYINFLNTLFISNKSKFENSNITLKLLLELYNKQNGECALSKLKMSNKIGDLYAISIDRINNNFGYNINNIQLVCQFINLGKNRHSNEDVFKFFELLKES